MSSQKMSSKTVKDAGKSKGGKRLMIDVVDFDITKWSSTEIDFEAEQNKTGNQITCYGRYNYGKISSPVENQLVFKTGSIKLVTYGIPQLGQYAKTDKDRSYIKIPFDKNQESCIALFNMFEAMDKWAIKNKEKFFTGKLSKFSKVYDYTPIVRKPQEAIPLDDEDEDHKPKQQHEKPMYAKIKISTDWQTQEVNTTVFLREDGIPVKQEVKTITDMANLVTWQSAIQMICACNKLWFGKSADKTGRRQFGLAFKILQCEVTEKSGGGVKSDFSTYAFDDTVKVESKEATKKESSDEDTDSEDEKDTKKVVKKDSSDEDTDSEDDKPKPTVANTDSDSDSSEDDKPVKKDVKDTKAKKQESSDDESEDEKPAPKPVAKKTAKSSR